MRSDSEMRSVGEAVAKVVAQAGQRAVRFHNRARKLHQRGPRLTAELLSEIGREYGLMPEIEAMLERYLAIPDAALDLVDGRRLPDLPLHLVENTR